MTKKAKDPVLVKRGKAARVKGQVGEREVCEIIRRVTGEDIKRNLGQERDSGCDISMGPFILEVKRQQRNKMAEWQQQVSEAAKESGKIPAIVWRRDGEKWWVACEFEVFLQIVNSLRPKDERIDPQGSTEAVPVG